VTAGGSARDRGTPLRGTASADASVPPLSSAEVARRLPRGSIGQRLRALLLVVGSWLARRLPERAAVRLATLMARLWYRATPDRAARARRNLDRVAGYLTERGMANERTVAAAHDPGALDRLVRAAYVHAALYYLEMIRTPAMPPQRLRERLLVETPDVVETAFGEDRPLIFIALHFGAIELPALYFAQRTGGTATVPMETLDDPELQRWFVSTRGKVGLRLVGLREARRELLAALRRGEPVGLVGDRDLTGGGIEIPFFGVPARLPAGPALLAIESGSPLYLAAVRRAGPGRYRGELKVIPVPAEGSRRERVTALLTSLAAAFEASIAKAPEQWWTVFFPIWDDLDPPPGTAPGAAQGAVAP
jgi:phosphatidylinositol dimannoside acyltransferase